MARRAGTGLEKTIEAEYNLQRTSNSGGRYGDGDLRHSGGRFIVEAKDWDIEGFSIPPKDLKKVIAQARMYGDGNWVWFQRKKDGTSVVAMNEALFKLMLSVCDGIIRCPCGRKIKPDW